MTKIFCDSNVLIAGFLRNHISHERARSIIERVVAGKDTGFAATHSLAEVYAVLTRLPQAVRVAPTVAWQLIHENVIKRFSIIALTTKDYAETLTEAATHGIEGGKTYDALLLKAAMKSGAEQIYTLNQRHFQEIASPQLRSKIVTP